MEWLNKLDFLEQKSHVKQNSVDILFQLCNILILLD